MNVYLGLGLGLAHFHEIDTTPCCQRVRNFSIVFRASGEMKHDPVYKIVQMIKVTAALRMTKLYLRRCLQDKSCHA